MSDERFLLIRLSAVGDVVNTLPTLSLLRRARPEATIGFLVEDRARDLIVGHPFVDRVHVFPRRRWRQALGRPGAWASLSAELGAYRREMREVGYQVAIDVQGNLKGALHALASGAKTRIGFARGYDRELAHLACTQTVVPPADRPHRVDKFASLLRPLGIDGDAREWVFPSAESQEAAMSARLAAVGVERGEAVMVHAGTSGKGRAKRWPIERFAELARRIAGDLDRPVVATWGPGEEGVAQEIAAAHPRAFAAPPTASLLDLLALLRMGRAFVSADTGPMHLAAAAGLECVALFGPKDPAVYAPYGDGHAVLYRPGGMDRISVDEVLDAVAALVRAP